MSGNDEHQLRVHLQEYDKLKDEQIMRIRFRDSMIPLALTAFGAITSFALAKPEYAGAFLTIPVICVVLGWQYMVSDEKVSHLGAYFRRDLADRMEGLLGSSGKGSVLGWEVMHREDPRRNERKRTQFAIDLLAFVFPGMFAAAMYMILSWQTTGWWCLAAIPLGLLPVWLGSVIYRYSDFSKSR
jgi:hypothetical protein